MGQKWHNQIPGSISTFECIVSTQGHYYIVVIHGVSTKQQQHLFLPTKTLKLMLLCLLSGLLLRSVWPFLNGNTRLTSAATGYYHHICLIFPTRNHLFISPLLPPPMKIPPLPDNCMSVLLLNSSDLFTNYFHIFVLIYSCLFGFCSWDMILLRSYLDFLLICNPGL